MAWLNHDFVRDYLNNNSPVGNEIEGQRLWLTYLKPYIDDFFIDTYGTAVGVINPSAPYKVVLEAHADEIAWYVKYITKEGYMYVARNGGSDYQIAPSMRALIHGEKGKVPAVFGWPAIHVRKEREKAKMDIENIILDGGFSSAEEVKERGIHIGAIVTFDQDLCTLNKKYWAGRALDNRMGGVTIAEVARKLKEKNVKLPFGLYIVNAVQEEVGLRGAKMIAERINPDVALITDVTHDTQSPLYSKVKSGDLSCGKGPVISISPSVQRNLYQFLVDIAQKEKIPFQRDAAHYTGTDTEAFAYARGGIPSALLSTPLKYMHTTVEMVAQQDVEHLVNWMYHFLLALKPNHSFDFTY